MNFLNYNNKLNPQNFVLYLNRIKSNSILLREMIDVNPNLGWMREGGETRERNSYNIWCDEKNEKR